MLFNSVSYLLFVTVVVSVHWALPAAQRVRMLLIASLVFYGLWRPEFVLLIMFSAFVDFYFALKIGNELRVEWRKVWLLCSLVINLGLLGYFKYAYFVLGSVATLGAWFGEHWVLDPGRIILPLGISFYTFLSISYTLDVYRGFCRPTREFPLYLTYVMFWPHMIAGPIMRAHELIPQLVRPTPFDADRTANGVKAILFGLLLKVGLADQLAPLVDDAFLTNGSTLSALDVWAMAFAFGLQIYFDFAGYSMIAIGSAGLVGVRFPDNFDWPYLASSPRDFWKRWHITLSSWIRDYLYLPLSGLPVRDRSEGGLEVQSVRPQSIRLICALFLTWFLMGLWHGANWTFAMWGLWHAVFIWLYRLISPRLTAIPQWTRALGGWGITLGVVMLGWILFRARTLAEAAVLLGRVVDWRAYTYLSFRESFYLLVAALLVAMLVLHFAMKLFDRSTWVVPGRIVDVLSIAVAAFAIVIFLRPVSQFIYFQF